MAVRTYELAFLNLLENPSPAVLLVQATHLGGLLELRKMIPSHRGVVEVSTAVGTRVARRTIARITPRRDIPHFPHRRTFPR